MMKNSTRFFIALALVLTQVMAWNVYAGNVKQVTVEVNDMLRQAREYQEKGLYQKAVDEYEKVLILRDQEEIRQQQIQAQYSLYLETPGNSKSHKAVAKRYESYISKYPQSVYGYEQAALFFLETGEPQSAIKMVRAAQDREVDSAVLQQVWTELRYQYRIATGGYVKVKEWSNGMYAVSDGETWDYITHDGSTVTSASFVFAGRFYNGYAFVKSVDGRAQLIDAKGVVELYLDDKYIEAGLYNNGALAVTDGETYDYINIKGDVPLSGYEYAGTFEDGKAMVQEGGTWKVINQKGETLFTTEFEDVVLDFMDTYNTFETFGAVVNGEYRLYSSETLERVSDFSCDGMDRFASRAGAAFEQDGKWGFVDMAGNVLVEPQYEAAKSFSNGYAAVCKDGLWGFINTEGNLVVDYTFGDAAYFDSTGNCMVVERGTWKRLQFLPDIY